VIPGRRLAVFVFIIFLSCTHKINDEKQVPADLIPKEQMVDICMDLKIMDAILTTKQKKKDSDTYDQKYYIHNSIMGKYGITRDRFERSVDYYQHDLKVMDEIYEEAITRLSKMKSEEDKKN
jgi:hypothetical protein